MRGRPTPTDAVFVAAFRLALMEGAPEMNGVLTRVPWPCHDQPKPPPPSVTVTMLTPPTNPLSGFGQPPGAGAAAVMAMRANPAMAVRR